LDRAYPKILRRRRGKRHHHGGNVCGLVVLGVDGTFRTIPTINPTRRELFVPAQTLIVVKLLTMIRGYCCQFDLLSNEYMVIVVAIRNLFYFFQKAEQLNADYHEDFMAMFQVIEEYGTRAHDPLP